MKCEYERIALEQAVPMNHRYREQKERLQSVLGELDLKDEHMLWMVVLQIIDGLTDAKLLNMLEENFCMRWFCGYSLTDKIVEKEAYDEYRRGLSAHRLVSLVKCVLKPNIRGAQFLSAMDLVLNERSDGAQNLSADQPFFVLVSKRSEQLVERIANAPELELMHVHSDGMLYSMAVRGERERIVQIVNAVPDLAVGAAEGCDWPSVLARARSACQKQQIQGSVGCLIGEKDERLRIVNLMLMDKRLVLENFLKESKLDQAYALFEDIVARLIKRASEIHWLQLRHELVKLFCAVYNGGFHYQQSAQFFTDYMRQLEALMYCSLDEAIDLIRSALYSFEMQQYQEVIAVGFEDYATAAKDMIEKYYATDLSLGELARHFGITPEYLSSCFRKSNGRNFVEYLTDVRIKHACQLLSYGDVKVNEVAHMVGFANADYFGKVFKQRMHMTPRQYQKNKT